MVLGPNHRYVVECLMHAAHSRSMWVHMRRSGYGVTWEFYREWLERARSIRLHGLQY